MWDFNRHISKNQAGSVSLVLKLQLMTKTFSILFVFLIIRATSPEILNNGKVYKKWIVEKSSSLSIRGETNVNSFTCDATEYLNADTLSYVNDDMAKKLNFSNSSLFIDIKRFDCHSKLITKDFRKALKADETPTLKITFLSLDQFNSSSNNQSIKGIVDIELAGINRRVEICYKVKMLSNNRIELNGSHSFTFSDFKLTAPKKMAGLIRTKEGIKVSFQLFFKAI